MRASPTYSKSEIAFGTSFVMVDHHTFDAKEPGVSTLKLKTAGDKFGGAFPATKLKDLEVLTIKVTVDPADVRLDPDQSQTFTATVENAENVTIKWGAPAPPLIIVGTPTSSEITLKAPPADANWSSQVSLRARSQADTGARMGKIESDPREGFSIISPKTSSITVSPNGLCVPLGETQDFTATVTGLTNTDVTWTASNGSFSGDTFRAPGTEDLNVVITATSVENSNIKGTANIEVSDCTCSWSAVTSIGNFDGKWASWIDQGLWSFGFGPGDGPAFPIVSMLVGEAITGPGTYGLVQAGFTLSSGDTPYIAVQLKDVPVTLPTLVVTSFDGKTVTGVLSGDLVQIVPNGPNEPTINVMSLRVNFRAQDINQNACPGFGAAASFHKN